MKRLALLALMLPLLAAAAAALTPADQAALDGAVAEIYAPYRQGGNNRSAWEYRGWSAQTAALIAHWRRVAPQDEIDDLSGGDWFCGCQDWDAGGFWAVVRARRLERDGRVSLTMRIALGDGSTRESRLIFRREAGGWRLDDLIDRDNPRGIKQALRETIAKDEALRK